MICYSLNQIGERKPRRRRKMEYKYRVIFGGILEGWFSEEEFDLFEKRFGPARILETRRINNR